MKYTEGIIKKALIFLFITIYFYAGTYAIADEKNKNVGTSSENEYIIELSFGASILDIDDAFTVENSNNDDETRRYPVMSALFIFEWLAFSRVTFVSMMNIPLEPRRVVKNNVVEEKNVATSVGAGPTIIPLRLGLFKQANLEFQTILMACTTINSTSDKGNYFFPLAGIRARIVTQNGFTLYLGSSYAFKKESISIIYGVGHRF